MLTLKQVFRLNKAFFLRRNFSVLTVATLFALLLTACYSSLAGSTGNVFINLGGTDNNRAAGLAYPPTDSLRMELQNTITLTSSHGKQTHILDSGVYSANFTLALGLWNIDVEARHGGDLYATGTASVHIEAGTNQALVTMERFVWEYTVTFNSNGGTPVSSIVNVEHGNPITVPTAPTRGVTGYYSFDDWYKDAALQNKWNFSSDTVTADITLFAKWTPLMNIGDTGPGGGMIFFVADGQGTMIPGYSAANTPLPVVDKPLGFDFFTGTGDATVTAHYLEAAPADIIEGWVPWSSAAGLSYIDIHGTGTAIGTGMRNTALILAHDATAPAALVTRNASNTGGILTDWFLPSKDELNQLRVNRDAVSNLGNMWYWSSSQYEYNSNNVWVHHIDTGTQANDAGKGEYWLVRAIRAF
jgi:uncharacterized repeat protein (TIGR02543 family)